MIRRLSILAAILILFLALSPAIACVGKTLRIGTLDGAQQEVLAQILSIIIDERTGTGVKIVPFDSSKEAHEALVDADLDMLIEYTGVGQVAVLGGEPIAEGDALYKEVKSRYQQELNLIWLKPFGFEDRARTAPDLPAEAAPVVRKDTLKKFPALSRLINKLGGRIDQATMAQLEGEVSSRGAKSVARSFLKDRKLI